MIIDINLFKKSFIYYVTAGITIIIALAWNTAFDSAIKTYVPDKNHTVVGHFIYAIVITTIFILLSSFLITKKQLGTAIGMSRFYNNNFS